MGMEGTKERRCEMRIIKFRGQKENGDWVYGSVLTWNGVNGSIYFQVKKGRSETMEYALVHPRTVGQFTGLFDKNGKEIYEGDVLMFQISVKRVVGYEDSHRACFSLLDQHLHYSSSFGSGTYESFYCEVIGNIHDNPELLKQ